MSEDKFETVGPEMEQKSVIWEIKNFDIVRKHDSMIDAQKLDIIAGDNIGQSSKWTVYLRVGYFLCTKWIGIYYKLSEEPKTKQDYLVSQCSFAFKKKDGKSTVVAETRTNSDSFLKARGFGFSSMMMLNGWGKREESLTIHITLKLYGPTNPNCRIEPMVQVEQLLKRFQRNSTAKVVKDLGRLFQEPMPGDVKIMSGDRRKEVMVPRGILAVRSPVLEAMLKSNMSEAIEGIICLSDLSDMTLNVLLNFIYTGELLPEWKESEVIVELTNAAAQYQLLDLLEFLDKVVGKVCNVENALSLFTLATQLELKTAEKELLKFAKENEANSVGNLCKV